jgi:uncharacterized cupin superfamily protein
MCSLATVTPASEVTEVYKQQAATWGIWDSANETKTKFPYSYPLEERVLILGGRATLTPDDGSPAFEIFGGQAVTFHAGFKCKWHVVEPMTKHFQLFEASGEPAVPAPSIACDACGGECYAESYFVAAGELDICPKCFKKARGADKKRYARREQVWSQGATVVYDTLEPFRSCSPHPKPYSPPLTFYPRYAGAERQVEGEAAPSAAEAQAPAAKKARKGKAQEAQSPPTAHGPANADEPKE